MIPIQDIFQFHLNIFLVLAPLIILVNTSYRIKYNCKQHRYSFPNNNYHHSQTKPPCQTFPFLICFIRLHQIIHQSIHQPITIATTVQSAHSYLYLNHISNISTWIANTLSVTITLTQLGLLLSDPPSLLTIYIVVERLIISRSPGINTQIQNNVNHKLSLKVRNIGGLLYENCQRNLFIFKQMENRNRSVSRFVSIFILTAVGHCISGSVNTTHHTIYFNLEATLSLGPIASSGGDNCNKMISKSDGLYHMAQAGGVSYLQQWAWPLSPLSTISSTYTFNFHFQDYDSPYNSSRLGIYSQDTDEQYIYDDFYSNFLIPTEVYDHSGSTGTQIFVWDNRTYVHEDNEGGDDTGIFTYLSNGSQSTFDVGFKDGKVVMTPDHSKIITWDRKTFIKVINSTSQMLLFDFDGLYATPNSKTDHIAISNDSILAAIEKDHHEPFTILNLTDQSIFGSYSYTSQQKIYMSAFIPETDLLLVVAQSSLFVLDLADGTFNQIANLSYNVTTSLFNGERNQLYLCEANEIRVFSIQTANNISSGQSVNQQSSQYDPFEDPDAVISLRMNQFEAQTTQTLKNGLESTSALIDKVILFALSNPFTYYFLTFNNFFTVSSHYALLNMPVPTTLYRYLSQFYVEINRNLVARLWTLPFQPLSPSKVSRNKLIYLDLTTDLATAQTANFLMVLFNFGLFQLLSCLTGKLSKQNLLRKLLHQPQAQILRGQYVALIMPLTSTWIFFIIGGVYKPASRLNLALQHLLFVINLCLSVYFLVDFANSHGQELKKTKKKKLEEKNKKQEKKESKLKMQSLLQEEKSQNKCTQNTASKDYDKNKKSKTSKRQNSQSKNKIESFSIQKKKTEAVKDRAYYQRKYLTKKNILGEEEERSTSAKKAQKSPIKTYKNEKGEEYAYYENERGVRWESTVPIVRPQKPKPSTPEAPKPSTLTTPDHVPLESLVTGDVLDQWYIIFSNFLYPLMLVVSNPLLPLCFLAVYSLFGVFIATKVSQHRKNRIILSLYPFLFHMCFVLFRGSSSNSVLVYSQLVCMGLLLVGSLHHFLFMIYTFCLLVYRHFKSKGRVSPGPSTNKEKLEKQKRVQLKNGQQRDRVASTQNNNKKSSRSPFKNGEKQKQEQNESLTNARKGLKVKRPRGQRHENDLDIIHNKAGERSDD